MNRFLFEWIFLLSFAYYASDAVAMDEPTPQEIAGSKQKMRTKEHSPRALVAVKPMVPPLCLSSSLKRSTQGLPLCTRNDRASFEAAANPAYLKLGKKFNPTTDEVKACYVFEDEHNSLSPCYDAEELAAHLATVDKIYDKAIDKTTRNAFRSVAPFVNFNLSKDAVTNLLSNYLDPTNTDRAISSTGSTLTDKEFEQIKWHLNLCQNVYTDYHTRDFFIKQKLSDTSEMLDGIILNYDNVKTIGDEVKAIEANLSELAKMKLTETKVTVVGQAMQTEKIAQGNYADAMQTINAKYDNVLLRLKSLIGEDISSLTRADEESAQQKIAKLKAVLIPIAAKTEQEYAMYFVIDGDNTDGEWTMSYAQLQAWVDKKFFGGQLEIKKHKDRLLTPKGVVIISFLERTQLMTAAKEGNVKVLDVGFRNEERFGSLLNNLATSLMFIKKNARANFDSWGEVDHISFIVRDSAQKKDKLVIVYAGSNSDLDWGIDFTTGSIVVSDALSVHAGIGWLFQASEQTYHETLMSRLRDYYKSMSVDNRPDALDIEVTGHSLGGGLAQIAAHHYKTVALNNIKLQTQIENVDVKAFTFAAPAIVSKNSHKKYENDLGKNNVYRVWVTNDPVAVLSESLRIQGGRHVGTNIPLYNFEELEKDFTDLWQPHGAPYYKAFINKIKDHSQDSNRKSLVTTLNNYIHANQLDVLKTNRNGLRMVRDELRAQQFPIKLSHGLAVDIIRYSPETAKFIPPTTIVDYAPDSPRALGALSPRFEAEAADRINSYTIIYNRYSITATFDIPRQKTLTFPIVKDTDCSRTTIRKELTDRLPHFTPTDDHVNQLSTGLCLAKHIFVSQFNDGGFSYYKPLTSALVLNHHHDTLTRMFAQCIAEDASTKEYVQTIAEGKNNVEKARAILKKVGLDERFNAKAIFFDRYQAQDNFELSGNDDGTVWLRPGEEVEADFYKPKASSPSLTVPMIEELFSKPMTFAFGKKELDDSNHLARKIIEAALSTNSFDNLQSLLNYDGIQFVATKQKLPHNDVIKATEAFAAYCETFKNNVLTAVDAYQEADQKYWSTGWVYSSALTAYDRKELENVLNKILKKITEDNLWVFLGTDNNVDTSDTLLLGQ